MLHVWNASVERVQVCSLFVICVCVCVCFIQLYIQFSFTNAALVISPSRFTYVSLLHFIVFSQFVSSCVFFSSLLLLHLSRPPFSVHIFFFANRLCSHFFLIVGIILSPVFVCFLLISKFIGLNYK